MKKFDIVQDQRLRVLCSYWLERRGDRTMPRRADIDPADLPEILPYVWVYDYMPPDRFRCRMIGERVGRLFYPPPVGRLIDEIFTADKVPEITNRFMSMVVRRQAAHTLGSCTLSTGRKVPGERITLPLSDDGEIADALIGATVYGIDELGAEMLFMSETFKTTFIDL